MGEDIRQKIEEEFAAERKKLLAILREMELIKKKELYELRHVKDIDALRSIVTIYKEREKELVERKKEWDEEIKKLTKIEERIIEERKAKCQKLFDLLEQTAELRPKSLPPDIAREVRRLIKLSEDLSIFHERLGNTLRTQRKAQRQLKALREVIEAKRRALKELQKPEEEKKLKEKEAKKEVITEEKKEEIALTPPAPSLPATEETKHFSAEELIKEGEEKAKEAEKKQQKLSNY